jgi:hypothetical protein
VLVSREQERKLIQVTRDWNRDCLPVCAETRSAALGRSANSYRDVYGFSRELLKECTMPFADTTRSDGTVEECLDELNDLLAGLRHYTPTVLAVALRVHLETLLQALLEGKVCTREEARDFVKELERDALQYDDG